MRPIIVETELDDEGALFELYRTLEKWGSEIVVVSHSRDGWHDKFELLADDEITDELLQAGRVPV